MKLFVTVVIPLLCCFTSLAGAQSQPPMPMQHIEAKVEESPSNLHRTQVDHALLKKQSEEMASLVSSLPPQIDQVKQGLLPKDLRNRLARIEKLAKQMRKELQP
jgi:hypothetical protein